jgi:hypothetical protein
MKILLQIVILVWSTLTFAQDKTYVLTKKTENADINYELFKTFNDFEIYKNDGLKRAFEPVEGEFTTYTFISEDKGLSFDGTEKLFHDYLILKVDPKTNEIIDGYQYTLEWAEPPAISDLYQVTLTGQKLKDGMGLNDLEMKLVDSDYKIESREDLKDGGRLKLK